MYSDEYYADTVALTMRRLNLTNTDLQKVIERHIKFFDSEARNKKLATYISIDDSVHADDMKLGMMAVLVKAAAPTIEAVLTELVLTIRKTVSITSWLNLASSNSYGIRFALLIITMVR